MQMHLDIIETEASFDETKIESQVKLSLLIPLCSLPEIKIYGSDISISSQTGMKVNPYKLG